MTIEICNFRDQIPEVRSTTKDINVKYLIVRYVLNACIVDIFEIFKILSLCDQLSPNKRVCPRNRANDVRESDRQVVKRPA